MPPEIICYGDCLQPGLYRLYSCFTHAANYVRDKTLISLVTQQTGGGPNNIVIEGVDFQKIDWVYIDTSYIDADGIRCNRTAEREYHSTVYLKDASIDRVLINLDTVEQVLLSTASPKSLFSMLKKPSSHNGETAFTKNLVQRVSAGLHEFFKNRYKEGTRLVSGAGYGLTPSGDDLLAGFLSGIFLIQTITDENLDSVREKVFCESRTESVISRSFIHYAYIGRFYEHTKKLIHTLCGEALCREHKKEVTRRTLRVISLGETSGADFITGLLTAFYCICGFRGILA